MKPILVTYLLLITSTIFAIPQFGSERQNRPHIELKGNWLKERVIVNHSLSTKERTGKVIAKIQKEAVERYLPDYNDAKWTGYYIPGPENPPPDRYEGGMWYRRKFTIPSEYKDKFIRLQFEGVHLKDKIKASYKNGVLEISLPKKEGAQKKEKRINIE